MRHFGKSFARLSGHGDEKPIRIVGKFGDKSPFFVGEFAAYRAPPGRLTVLPYGCKPKRQHAPQRIFSAWSVSPEICWRDRPARRPSSKDWAGRRSVPSPRCIMLVHMSSSV